jgi:hypothetical protein
MKGRRTDRAILAEWASVPGRLRKAVGPLSARELEARGGSQGSSIREYAHHLVEANLVASTIVIAALGKPDCKYDWSWLFPDKTWMKRLGYDRAPLGPAIRLLEALCAHVVGITRSASGSMGRSVRLIGTPGGRGARRTVRRVLEEECEHARHHLRDIAKAKVSLRPSSRKRTPA